MVVVRTSRELEKLLGAVTSEVVRRVQLRTWQTITSAHPVDTGFSRGFWTPTVGSPASETVERPIDRRAASAQGSNALSANRARAERIASSYQVRRGKVFLTNLVSYVRFLNEGSSSQAPAKFIERAIAAGIRSIGNLN